MKTTVCLLWRDAAEHQSHILTSHSTKSKLHVKIKLIQLHDILMILIQFWSWTPGGALDLLCLSHTHRHTITQTHNHTDTQSHNRTHTHTVSLSHFTRKKTLPPFLLLSHLHSVSVKHPPPPLPSSLQPLMMRKPLLRHWCRVCRQSNRLKTQTRLSREPLRERQRTDRLIDWASLKLCTKTHCAPFLFCPEGFSLYA